MKHFTVVIALTAECCVKPHLWIQTVKAKDPKAAMKQVLSENDMGFPSEVAVFPGVNRVLGQIESVDDLK